MSPCTLSPPRRVALQALRDGSEQCAWDAPFWLVGMGRHDADDPRAACGSNTTSSAFVSQAGARGERHASGAGFVDAHWAGAQPHGAVLQVAAAPRASGTAGPHHSATSAPSSHAASPSSKAAASRDLAEAMLSAWRKRRRALAGHAGGAAAGRGAALRRHDVARGAGSAAAAALPAGSGGLGDGGGWGGVGAAVGRLYRAAAAWASALASAPASALGLLVVERSREERRRRLAAASRGAAATAGGAESLFAASALSSAREQAAHLPLERQGDVENDAAGGAGARAALGAWPDATVGGATTRHAEHGSGGGVAGGAAAGVAERRRQRGGRALAAQRHVNGTRAGGAGEVRAVVLELVNAVSGAVAGAAPAAAASDPAVRPQRRLQHFTCFVPGLLTLGAC